ncbi:MAG: hypothetical protein L3J75_03635 [Methylococcaceae bacterium]|nr:hypothetical protein [Methylococcaceae bacterium]
MAYNNSLLKWLSPILVSSLLLLLSGCGNDYAQQTQKNYNSVEQHLKDLGNKLDRKQLTNAKIIDIYAKKLTLINPDLQPVAEALAKDATRKGNLYQGLSQRLQKINRKPENKQQFDLTSQSLMSIDAGADPIVFNDALIDLINTMAELSGGQLNTISIPKDSQAANVRGETITPGSYLIGNPGYGEYRQDNSGRSFWHWYGQYAFFNSLFRGGMYNRYPTYYNDWNSRPHYSYYRDYGRTAYGSQQDRYQTTQRDTKMRNNGLTPAKPKKQYGSVQGRQRVSTYSQRVNNSGKKYGSTNSGARHADKGVSKRSSSYFGSNTTSLSNKVPSRRSSSFFGNSSSARSSSRSRGFGGK